jgi:uncharacterized GH25 family protein
MSWNDMKRWHVPRWYVGLGGALAASVTIAVIADAHDLFLRPADFVVKPNAQVHLRVLNGTFTASESPVARERIRDLTIAGPDGVSHADVSSWTLADGGTSAKGGKESAWQVSVRGAGTYMMGASVHPKTIRLTGKQFNSYLHEDGLPDVLAARRADGTLEQPAHERYSKHVKALVRVEDRATRETATPGDTAFARVLGYPAELVPLADPYRLRPGAVLRVRALVDGQPVPSQVVLAGGRTASGAVIPERSVRTGADGVASIPLRAKGAWYVKFIRMRPVPASAHDSVNYESKWATLTFAVR